MLIIECPHCGPRMETEFHYGGQADIAYPADAAELTDAEWGRFLFYRDNPRGQFRERWVHTAGCRRWLTITRDTLSNEFTTAPEAVGTSGTENAREDDRSPRGVAHSPRKEDQP
ncbi:sarcosine oxidase subunit delta [Brevibacterium otitidis]|uniref:Sarcosine oxidase subunit delta n=1 Tax=Brevibacterium otitidis TaxID=53364 RepID=A0ABV5WZW5_9MICO|nr:hypothetical protein GCM10023233_26550 [Brevibacterium otitidis]